jgi:hypothetical protein
VKHRAYIVAFIQRGTPSTVNGAGIFGEEHPTTTSRLITMPVYWCDAVDYARAEAAAKTALQDAAFDWLGELKHDDVRGTYRDARKQP